MLRTLDLSDNVVAARVVAIQQAAYRVEADLIGFDGIPQLHESVDNLPLHQLQWMGSWEGNALVGFVAWCASADQCEIDRLAVHPDFHRRGHGRSLVGSLLTHRVVIVSTGTANIPGLGLYESLGFRRVGVREVAPAVTVTELHWLQPTWANCHPGQARFRSVTTPPATRTMSAGAAPKLSFHVPAAAQTSSYCNKSGSTNTRS